LTVYEKGNDMNKIVDTLIVAAMLMTSVPSLSDAAVLVDDPTAQTQTVPEEVPEDGESAVS